MKTFCSFHGAHFSNEFKNTLHWRCPLWKEKGLKNMPNKYKKKIWDWSFALPIDEIGLKTGFILRIGFEGNKAVNKSDIDWFMKNIPGYKNLSDKDKREFQKSHFKSTELEHLKKLSKLHNSLRFKFKVFIHKVVDKIL